MKCALELTTIATVKAEENRKREAIEKKKKELALYNNTIALCEKIGKELETMAESGKTPCYRFTADYNSWQEEWNILTITFSDYADKRMSYRHSDIHFDMDAFTKWFAKYCFKVTTLTNFGYIYNLGRCKLTDVYIKPDIQC